MLGGIDNPMRALIAGLGYIGRKHLANLRRLEPSADIVVWRQKSRDSAVPPGANSVVFSLQAAISRGLDIAFLTNPATLHVPTGMELARAGAALFLERPIAASMDGVDELLALCKRRGLPVMVGYPLRFDPALRILRDAVAAGKIGRMLHVRAEVGQYLPDSRSGADYRRSAGARAELGGGAILELSSELDYARWIGGEISSVTAQASKVSYLEIDTEDHADILLQFASGATGCVHMDMFQRTAVHQCRVAGTEGTAVWDGINGDARLYSVADRRWTQLVPAEEFDRNQMYIEEMRAFLKTAREGSTPPVTGDDGRHVLQIALAAKRSAQEQHTVEVQAPANSVEAVR